MKTALPENAKIAKEAKECMQECVSEFISFITSEASEKCQQEKRKTVNGEDILFAMTSLGFENYAEALKIYLSKYREVSGSRSLLSLSVSNGHPSRASDPGETQSARGENQNRPGSGYGAGGQPGGGGNAGSGPNASSSAVAYRGHAEGPNNILSPHGLESTEQESSPYGNVYPPVVGSSHNGAGGESY
ncbi:MAG: hypothetical protein LQ347_006578 [Umbilicaria vellea]|nr:MAG: hypothetical protein LQ347_006578 [Umbilicaria vellea]